MADGKIYITISDERGSVGPGGPITPSTPKPKKEKKQKPSELEDMGDRQVELDYLNHELVHLLKSQALNMINFSISNIGNFTGSSQAQRDVQEAVGLLGNLTSIGLATAQGFSMGQVPGAIAGAVIATGSILINREMGATVGRFEVQKRNRNNEILRSISGMDALTNGSR